MNFLILIKKESIASINSLMAMATISGIANGALLAIINTAASHASNENVSVRFFIMFVITIILFIYTKRYALKESTVIIEEINNKGGV